MRIPHRKGVFIMTKQRFFNEIKKEAASYTYSNGAPMSMPKYALIRIFVKDSTWETIIQDKEVANDYLNEFVRENLLRQTSDECFLVV